MDYLLLFSIIVFAGIVLSISAAQAQRQQEIQRKINDHYTRLRDYQSSLERTDNPDVRFTMSGYAIREIKAIMALKPEAPGLKALQKSLEDDQEGLKDEIVRYKVNTLMAGIDDRPPPAQQTIIAQATDILDKAVAEEVGTREDYEELYDKLERLPHELRLKPWLELGAVYISNGERKKAEQQFQKAREIMEEEEFHEAVREEWSAWVNERMGELPPEPEPSEDDEGAEEKKEA